MRSALALTLLVVLAACDSSEDDAGLVGAWRLYSIAGGFAGLPPTPVSQDTQLRFDGDGRFSFVDAGVTASGRYTVVGDAVVLNYDRDGDPSVSARRFHPDSLVFVDRNPDGMTSVYGRLAD